MGSPDRDPRAGRSAREEPGATRAGGGAKIIAPALRPGRTGSSYEWAAPRGPACAPPAAPPSYPQAQYIRSPARRRTGPGWRLLLLAAWFLTGLALLPAAEGPRRSYQLPAGDASRTLQEFSAASGREILFAANAIRGVQTRAVQGEYTDLEALSAMLEGTPLFAMEDVPTGALAVRRRAAPTPIPTGPPPSAPPPAPPRSADSASTAPPAPLPMPRKSLFALLSSWLLAPLASAAEPTATTVSEPAIQLSPFEIRTDKDTGFIATSALTGGRLATDLRDTPIAYSIVTKDFISALGLTDIGEAAQWSTGNFPVIDTNVGLIQGNPIQYTTRGFNSFGGTNGGGKPQRNFFPQFNNSDSYNLERYEFGRGPNSILFGNGTLGGIPSSTTIRARTDRPSQEVSIGFGSWNNLRATIDINQPLRDWLAVRTALVWQDSKGWRDRDFDKRKGGFLTATIKPFKNTEIRVDVEQIRTSKQAGLTYISDVISGWDAVTTFNAALPLLSALPDLDQRGIFRITTPVYMYYPNGPFDGIVNIQYQSQTRQGAATPLTPYGGFVQGSLPAFGTANAPMLHADHYVPANRFAKAIAGSNFRPFSDDFTTAPDAPALSQRFRDIQLALSQRIGESLFLEVAADVNQDQLFGMGIQGRGMTNILIDINRVFPTGIANPNFLQPYVEGNTVLRNNYTFSFYSVRGAAAYVMKPTRFGTFSFNLMGGGTRAVRDQDWRGLSMATAPDHREWGILINTISQNVRYRYYLNQAHRPVPDLSKRTVPYYDPVTGVTREVRPIWAVGADRVDTQATDISETKYALVAGNAKFFKDRLVVLGALRKDYYNFRVHRTLDVGDYPRDWDGVTRFHRPEAPADYYTLMYQPRNTNGTPNGPMREAANRPRVGALRDRDPLYANDRFKDDYNVPVVKGNHLSRSVGAVAHVAPWFNPFFNYAETFNPPDGTVRITNQSRGPTEAWGRDYGLRFELFNQRLNFSALKYEASEDNAIEGTATPNFNALFNANVVGDQSLTGRNIRGVADLPTTYRDSRSRVNEGYEFELVWNPLRGFRLTANYARPKTGFGNRFPEVLAYIQTNRDTFRQIARDAGVIIDANDNAREDTSIPAANRSPDVAAAVSSYNAIVTFEKTFSGNAPTIGDNPQSANFYADYTFQRGFLRNVRVGAGVQWRGRISRGNRGADTIVDPTNPTRAIDDPAVSATDLIYAPSYHLVTATLGYTWKLKDRRELQANLVVNNLLNDRDVMYLGTNLAPRGGDYTSPARQAVLGGQFQFKQPTSYNLRLTMKL